jgi:hypothetical protein
LSVKLTPEGNAPIEVRAGVGEPVVVTVNEPAWPTANVAALPLVMAGACPMVAVITTSAAFAPASPTLTALALLGT